MQKVQFSEVPSLSFLRAILFIDPMIALWTVVMGTISIVASLAGASADRLHRLARFWGGVLLRLTGSSVTVEGVEKLDPARSYVLVANHASYMDTPVIMANIPLQFRFFAKKGLFSIPFIGTHLKHAGHIPVVRDDPRASLRTLSDGAKLIRERGISVLLFPEGGRSEQHLREFKEGAAYLAIKAGVPAVPVGVVGTRAMLPMHSVHVRGVPLGLRIGTPIETAGMTLHDRGRLNERLHRAVAELIGEPPVETAPLTRQATPDKPPALSGPETSGPFPLDTSGPDKTARPSPQAP